MSGSIVARLVVVALPGGLLSGCALNPPTGLEDPLPQAPTKQAVQAAPERYLGERVRWGGEILGVENQAAATEVAVYGRPLFNNAEPRPEGGEGVRFIARFERFLDPAEYSAGKRLTVRGRLTSALTRKVGEYAYRYPVVEVEAHHLWPAYEPPPEPAWFRDPYYDPWWPWGPWGPWGPYGYWPYRHWPYGW
jgi:outer membrane lipoprotein